MMMFVSPVTVMEMLAAGKFDDFEGPCLEITPREAARTGFRSRSASVQLLEDCPSPRIVVKAHHLYLCHGQICPCAADVWQLDRKAKDASRDGSRHSFKLESITKTFAVFPKAGDIGTPHAC